MLGVKVDGREGIAIAAEEQGAMVDLGMVAAVVEDAEVNDNL